jgi:hypothetical protein
MGSSTDLDSYGRKKPKEATLKAAIVCAVFNAFLGAVLGVVILATTAPVAYPPKADDQTAKAGAQTAKIPPPPAGLFYWPGDSGGDFQSKEDQFLAGSPGGVTVSDGELNAWAGAMFKSSVGQSDSAAKDAAKTDDEKQPVSVADKAKAKVTQGVKTAEADLKTWGIDAGTPNFHAFKDPAAPADAPVCFQVALPMTITLFGVNFNTVYQARGVFVAGSTGPQFKPYYSFLGNARIPVLPGLAQKVFNIFASKYAGGDDVKDYADAWAKLPGATVRDGALVLGGK